MVHARRKLLDLWIWRIFPLTCLLCWKSCRTLRFDGLGMFPFPWYFWPELSILGDGNQIGERSLVTVAWKFHALGPSCSDLLLDSMYSCRSSSKILAMVAWLSFGGVSWLWSKPAVSCRILGFGRFSPSHSLWCLLPKFLGLGVGNLMGDQASGVHVFLQFFVQITDDSNPLYQLKILFY